MNWWCLTRVNERFAQSHLLSTHLYWLLQLLLGCALPFMLSFGLNLCVQRGSALSKNEDLPLSELRVTEIVLSTCQLLPYLGLITVGIGDAMAAIIGSKYGRHRWVPSSVENKRTLEGTLAGCFSMYICAGDEADVCIHINILSACLLYVNI